MKSSNKSRLQINMKIIITGGLGYIGSHAICEYLAKGHEVVVVDNLCNSRKEVVSKIETITGILVENIEISLLDKSNLIDAFKRHKPDAVVHLAGLKSVSDSFIDPILYYNENLNSTINLLTAMELSLCKRIIFSSSATIYDHDMEPPFCENFPLRPNNPYGRTKLFIEKIISDFVNSGFGRSAVCLRYFNPIGAHPSGEIGEHPRQHLGNLMPQLIKVGLGQEPNLSIYGNDYPTPDGTCERDFIHVVDLAKAHLSALVYAVKNTKFEAINIGTGQSTSVLSLVREFERVNRLTLPVKYYPRRKGDVIRSYAKVGKALKLLKWQSELSIADSCKSAWLYAANRN